MKIILHWILLSISIWFTSQIVSGIIVDPIWVSLIVGACLALFNTFVKPIIKILTLPLNMITFGLFSLVINGAILWYLGTAIKGFVVWNFWAAFVGAVVISIFNWLLLKVLHFD